MKKIPTLFVRDEETQRRYVRDEVTPGCEWVLAGEGVATRKYDGTCVMYLHGQWWARREVKQGKAIPEAFLPIETDEVTGKTVGWEPADRSGFYKWLTEALEDHDEPRYEGTYELCGPKVNGNPEGCADHRLIRHTDADVLLDSPRSFAALAGWLHAHDYEGIVWHLPDGRMAKLKKRDFPAGSPEEGPL